MGQRLRQVEPGGPEVRSRARHLRRIRDRPRWPAQFHVGGPAHPGAVRTGDLHLRTALWSYEPLRLYSPLADFALRGGCFLFPGLGRCSGPSGDFFSQGGCLPSRGPDRVLQLVYGAGRGLSCCAFFTYRQTHGQDTTRSCSASSCGSGPGRSSFHATTASSCSPGCQV